MELAVLIIPPTSPGGVIMYVNKVHSVKTIDRVAKELDESVDWLHDVADEMDTEDDVIWVNGDIDDSVMAFTESRIETLMGLIEMHKEDPTILERRISPVCPTCCRLIPPVLALEAFDRPPGLRLRAGLLMQSIDYLPSAWIPFADIQLAGQTK